VDADVAHHAMVTYRRPASFRMKLPLESKPAYRRRSAAFISTVCLGATIFLALFGRALAPFMPGCAFHAVTGLHCPGCGATRAVFALLRGDFSAAISLNALFVFGILPLLLILFVNETIIAATGRGLRPLKPARFLYILLFIAVAFGVARNIPLHPFTLLAPR